MKKLPARILAIITTPFAFIAGLAAVLGWIMYEIYHILAYVFGG